MSNWLRMMYDDYVMNIWCFIVVFNHLWWFVMVGFWLVVEWFEIIYNIVYVIVGFRISHDFQAELELSDTDLSWVVRNYHDLQGLAIAVIYVQWVLPKNKLQFHQPSSEQPPSYRIQPAHFQQTKPVPKVLFADARIWWRWLYAP